MKIITTTIAIIAAALLASCTLTVSPDGTRTYGVDANTAAEILIQAAK